MGVCVSRQESDSEVDLLRGALVVANAEIEVLRSRWLAIRVSTPLTRVEYTEWEPCNTERYNTERYRWWQSWCPSCRRPIDVTSFGESWDDGGDCSNVGAFGNVVQSGLSNVEQLSNRDATCSSDVNLGRSPSYAYVAAVWGDSWGFVLGALVLGCALKRTGTKHDLVLLHTDDVPTSFVVMLSRFWHLHPVSYVDAVDSLFYNNKGGRFAGVFTKLHVFGLVQYDKVLMLDIDLVILHCLDDLFDLPAPAAMRRGMGHYEHGARIDCRGFFGGMDEDWCQSGGINAGVMLLVPDLALYQRVMLEVNMSGHPEHIQGTGPEQDYLSRLFASCWHHISVIYNCQIHHIWFALEAAVQQATSVPSSSTDSVDCCFRHLWLPMRLDMDIEEVRVVHFSGEFKLWHRNYEMDGCDDVDFMRLYLRENAPDKYRLWIDKAGEPSEYSWYGVSIEDDVWKPTLGSLVTSDTLANIIECGVSQVTNATFRAVIQWRVDLEATADILGGSVTNLLRDLKKRDFEIGARVQVYWHADESLNLGTVTGYASDVKVFVAFDDFGTHAMPKYLLRRRVRVYWPADASWSRGTVIGEEVDSKVTVVFDDVTFGTHPISKTLVYSDSCVYEFIDHSVLT